MKRAVLSIMAALSLAAAAQGVYKWVDEKGVTHYSESPPPDGKANKVDIKPNGPAGPVKEPDWKARELESRQQNVQKNQADREQKAKEDNDKATRRNICQQALRQITTLQTAVPVYTLNEKGERVYMEDADRQQKVEAAQQRMRENCD